MQLRIHDPGHVALHRGVRAAIGTPIATALGLWLLPGTPAALIAAFGVLVIVSTADFGGSRIERLRAILGTAAVGLAVLSIGVLAGLSIWSAVLVTFVVTASLAFIAVLHGNVASATPALTIIYVVSVSLGVPATSLGPILLGWAIAVAIALPLALFVLPRRTTAPVRQATAAALQVLADIADRRTRGEQPDMEALVKAEADLQHSYLGNPFRAAGFNRRNQGLLILVAQVQGLLAAFIRGRGYFSELRQTPTTLQLVEETARSFRTTAAALSDPAASAPSGLAVARTWEDQWNEATGMLMQSSPDSAPATVREVFAMFPDRALGLSSARITMLARRALGLPPEDYAPVLGPHTIPEPPVPDLWLELRSQATLRSPWARLALRTGAALALAMVVVQIMGLAHGFWVMLGVISVLRFDTFTTIKTGVLAIAGTLIGALVGLVVIVADAQREGWMWAIFAAVVFLATWAPTAVGFMLGQGAFSLFVIIAFSLISWPPDLATAEQRVLDICVGVLLSIVVASIMWPRGVLRGLLDNVAEAITVGTALLTGGIAALVHGPTAQTRALPREANAAIVRSREVVELSLSSSNPAATAVALHWQALLDHLRTLMVSGHLLANWSYDHPPIEQFAPPLGPPLESECGAVTTAWNAVADGISGEPIPVPVAWPDTLDQLAEAARTLDLTSSAVANRATAAIWGHGWLVVTGHAAEAAIVPAAGGTA